MQFEHYHLFEPDNILLITPSPTLTSQHLKELALSGIPARYALQSGSPGDVQVLEITKLYVDRRDIEIPRGGDSLPTSTFEGQNLLVVDEGHKGSTTRRDQEEDRKWRDIRASLAGNRGFTLEYSATFAQITENNDELLDEYGKTILFDYGYRHFWEDGFGKDYRVVNVAEEGAYDTDELLLAGLLVLYEQARFFGEGGSGLEAYNLEPPLMVFIGATVTGQVESEVLRVVRFLDRVVTEPEWASLHIEELLEGSSALPADLFTHSFPYLDDLDMSVGEVYADLCARLFRGTGRLSLHMIQRSEGEIGIRTADSAADVYCGVVNVGNATGFMKNAEEAGLTRGEDDHITDSVFNFIDIPGSSVSFLVGSRKFIEGWSSWRVSVMGLLKVGKRAGPQVIQLFGRGVRLKGKELLKRSSHVPGSHPKHLPLLETLHIFGLRADYMQTFNEAIRREGVQPPVLRTLRMNFRGDIEGLGLQVPDPGTYDFYRDDVVVFDPEAVGQSVEINLLPTFTVAVGLTDLARTVGSEPPVTDSFPADLVDSEAVFLDALDYKRQRGWYNTYVTRTAIRDFLRERVSLTAPASLFAPHSKREFQLLVAAARDATHKGLERFVYSEQRRRETRKLTCVLLTKTHPNFPRVNIEQKEVIAYQLQVPEDVVEEVDKLIAKLESGSARDEDFAEPLPRLHVDRHLYNPLLVKESDAGPQGRQLTLFHEVRLRSTPGGLVESEITFLRDLREFWRDHGHTPDWSHYEVYFLRNLPKRGVGFFTTAGFYPDFLVWLKRDTSQALAFVEPHGMVIWSPLKVDLLQQIREIGLTTPTVAWIVTKTAPRSIGAVGGSAVDDEWLRDHYILFQGEGYIEEILGDLRTAVDSVVAGQYAEGSIVPELRRADGQVLSDSQVPEEIRYVEFLPVYSLEAAAGHFGEGMEVEREGWVRVEGRISKDMFVARVVGRSMEPRIFDGDLCVFRLYRGGSRDGLTVLVQWVGPQDPETGGSYAVKQYSSEKRVVDGRLEGFRVRLSPRNPEFDVIELDARSESEVAVIAEFREVLRVPTSAGQA
jgi:hypothetical protein